MNKTARKDLLVLFTDLRVTLEAIETNSPLTSQALEQLAEVQYLIQMLNGLQIGIDRVLNEIQYSLATLGEFFDPWDAQTARIQMAIDEITDFLTSPRYRKHPNTY